MAPEGAPAAPIGPYTAVVRAGEWLICSGQLGLLNNELVAGGTGLQIRQAIANLSTLLGDNGATLQDVVKTTVFLADIGDYAEMNEAYMDAFGSSRPARSAIGVAGLPRGALVEIEAWARVGSR